MNNVSYDTKKIRGVTVSTTLCDRRRDRYRYVGSIMCMACSYCYDVDRENKIVKCRKNILKVSAAPKSGT